MNSDGPWSQGERACSPCMPLAPVQVLELPMSRLRRTALNPQLPSAWTPRSFGYSTATEDQTFSSGRLSVPQEEVLER